ncbi:MAG: hypothetical protein A2868_00585 [Candidatus Levybacteria bacterium RIFCSPHIGHO2_01_FULL_40_15b]|nr:MAG: hypothetical protein A2868_00585 [Candidatus Levybacteria bacterium RIFCSPHIGHO2_01_FULL_40_15b]
MGQKVAQGEGLTHRQEEFLAVVLQTPYILKKFYLSGGTALSCWYLHHRDSFDLDFFSEQEEVNSAYLIKWIASLKDKLGVVDIIHEVQFGFNFFNLTYSNGDKLKVDFSYFPSERIEKGIVWKGLEIDSLYDIAVNKFHTIATSPRGRDYVDLYFILKQEDYPIEQLINDAAIKHGVRQGTMQVAKQLLKSSEFTDISKILVPFNKDEMNKFFSDLAKSLEVDIFK